MDYFQARLGWYPNLYMEKDVSYWASILLIHEKWKTRENTLLFLKIKLQFSKIYINIREEFEDMFEYERKNMKLSHVSFFIHVSLMWKGLVRVWYCTIKTRSLNCCPGTSFTSSRVNTKGCSQPVLLITSQAHETYIFLHSKGMKAHVNYKGYTQASTGIISYLLLRRTSSDCCTPIKAVTPSLPLPPLGGQWIPPCSLISNH